MGVSTALHITQGGGAAPLGHWFIRPAGDDDSSIMLAALQKEKEGEREREGERVKNIQD